MPARTMNFPSAYARGFAQPIPSTVVVEMNGTSSSFEERFICLSVVAVHCHKFYFFFMHLASLFTLANMVLEKCTLTYFGFPGRGEATRLALSIAGIEFTDERIGFKDWPSLKPTTTWRSLPFLTLSSGQKIGQQRAVLRFVGKETGLYPTSDTLKAALVDSLIDAAEDIGTKLSQQGQGLPQAEKEAARAKAIAKGGVTYNALSKIESFIGENGIGGHCVGDSLTIADLFIYTTSSTLISGLYDGVPLDAIDEGFPNIMAVRKNVRSHAAVKKWYDGLDEKSIPVPSSFGPL